MKKEETDELIYTILDPTGNITAIVESPVETSLQVEVATELMSRHPEVEQVGFISYDPFPSLRMAGGEFCGNASMCAAALILMHRSSTCLKDQEPDHGLIQAKDQDLESLSKGFAAQDVMEENDQAPSNKFCDKERIELQVSGAREPVEVELTRKSHHSFLTGIHMPQASGIMDMEFTFGSVRDTLPLISMGGISHIILEPESPFAHMLKEPAAAEAAIRLWGDQLAHEGLGLMFLTSKKLPPADPASSSLTYDLCPLVYIPGSKTLFWEHSCASGSAAVGVYLAGKYGTFIKLTLQEPGGCLQVTSNPDNGETWLYGEVIIKSHLFSNR